jgi:hypothetical protein
MAKPHTHDFIGVARKTRKPRKLSRPEKRQELSKAVEKVALLQAYLE